MAQTDVVVHNEDIELLEKYPHVSSEDLRQRFDLVTAQRILLAHARIITLNPSFKITKLLYRQSRKK